LVPFTVRVTGRRAVAEVGETSVVVETVLTVKARVRGAASRSR
jgi:hypothetical protein